MPVDFNSEEYLGLSVKEKLQLAVNEFQKCSESFEYYVSNYAYIRHPNAGAIKMDPFPFQLDVAVPISEVLKYRRSQESISKLREYRYKFDYEKWWNKIAEEQIELAKCIPPVFHEFYKTVFTSPDYHTRVDTIILKSRQTGISTIFQQLIVWHINFHSSVTDIVLSKTDREAKKFLKDAVGSWELLPNPLKARKMTRNEHELWLSITGNLSHISGVQVLPPTPDAGRSFDPNLVVLDEFATYRNAEEVWAAVSMCVSAGGIIVIIATPKGVGNLYHKIWTATKKSLTAHISKNALSKEEQDISAFRPVVVHWSQLPEEEFKRRGFSSAVDWYRHMRAKLAMQGGERLVAQELDLNFNASGNTIDANIIAKLEKNALENTTTPKILDKEIPGLRIYEPPLEDYEYVIGVDTSEGIGQDYHSFHVLKVPKEVGIPEVVAFFSHNNISIKEYKDILKKTALLYNNAYLNIERNNYGHTLLVYFVEEGDYISEKILNKYNVGTNTFSKDTKGWMATQQSRSVMIRMLFDFIQENQDTLKLPLATVEEFKTFVQNKHGKWEHQPGYHDDNIISLGLAVVAYTLLPKYKQFLQEQGEAVADVLPQDSAFTSHDLPEENRINFKVPERESYLTKDEFDPEEFKRKLILKDDDTEETQKVNSTRRNYHFLSTVTEWEEEGVDIF